MGLQLSGSVQLEGNLLVTGSTNSVFQNVLVSGRLTAQEIETQLVSSSIIYSSGSNKFGDESSDKHQFTGSMLVTGSLAVAGAGTLTGALNGTSAVFNHNDAPTIRVQRNSGTDSNTVLEFTNATRSFFIGSNGAEMGLGGTSGAINSQPLKIAHTTGAATFSSSVTAGGNAAFNTTSAVSGYALDVRGATNKRFGVANSNAVSGAQLVFFTDANAFADGYIDASKLILQSGTGGNVGIGTDTPDRNLEVETGSDTYLRVTGNRGNADGLHVGNLEFYNSNTTRLVGEVRGITGTGGTQSNSGQLAFYTNDNGTYAERMRITSAGNLGLGVSNPTEKLHLTDTTNGFVGMRLSGSGDYTGTDWTLYASSEAAPSATDFFGIYNNTTTDSATADYKLKVYKDGNVSITNGNLVIGTAGKGIDFSITSNSSGTMTSELLNDYEEGTWTPVIEGETTNPTLTGYATQVGRYTKIGRVVTIHCALQPSGTSVAGTGNLRFGGLPFTSANITDVVGTGVAASNGDLSWGSGKTQLNFSVGVNTTKINVYAMQNGTTEAGVPVNNFNNSSQYLLFSLTYMAT